MTLDLFFKKLPLALALAAMALPAAVQAGPSRDVADALHGHVDTDRVALERVERLADRDGRGDDLAADAWSRATAAPRRAASESRETTSHDAYPWRALTRDRDGRDAGEGHGRRDGQGRDERGGHDRGDDHGDHDGREGHHGHNGHNGHHAGGDRDDFELGEHGAGEGHFNGSATPVSPVPVPAAAWFLGLGLLGLVGARRRQATGAHAGNASGAAAA